MSRFRLASAGLAAGAVLLLLLNAGCRTSTKYAFLNLIGLSEKPLTIMHVAELDGQGHLLKLFNPFEAYEPLNAALGEALGRKVTPDYCMPFQLEPSLAFGTSDVAVLTPVQYAALGAPDKFRPIAVPIDEQGRQERPAVLLVRADSGLKSIAELKGQSVAFGKASDGRTHHAGLALLKENGVARSDLKLELLPLPGSIKHLQKAEEVVQQVLKGQAAAGFVDLRYWERLPETAAADQASRAGLRELGRTAALPSDILIAAAHVDEATIEKIRSFLLSARTEHPEALTQLDIAGYGVPQAAALTQWVERVRRANVPVQEPASPPSQEPQPQPDSQSGTIAVAS